MAHQNDWKAIGVYSREWELQLLGLGYHHRFEQNARCLRDLESTRLRVLVLYANPVTVSFGATLYRQAVTTLRSRGHEIDACDLYAEGFNPVMSEQERMHYHNVDLNRALVADYAERLLAAEALTLI